MGGGRACSPAGELPIRSLRCTLLVARVAKACIGSRSTYTCRECEKEINEGTEICPHCRADLTAYTPEGRAARKTPLTKILVRWISLLVVLGGAVGFFVWYFVKHRMP